MSSRPLSWATSRRSASTSSRSFLTSSTLNSFSIRALSHSLNNCAIVVDKKNRFLYPSGHEDHQQRINRPGVCRQDGGNLLLCYQMAPKWADPWSCQAIVSSGRILGDSDLRPGDGETKKRAPPKGE